MILASLRFKLSSNCMTAAAIFSGMNFIFWLRFSQFWTENLQISKTWDSSLGKCHFGWFTLPWKDHSPKIFTVDPPLVNSVYLNYDQIFSWHLAKYYIISTTLSEIDWSGYFWKCSLECMHIMLHSYHITFWFFLFTFIKSILLFYFSNLEVSFLFILST